MSKDQPPLQEDLQQERQALLEQLQEWLEAPMVVLAFLWLALFVAEVIWGLTPLLEIAGYVIWILFLVEFAVGLTSTLWIPQKLQLFGAPSAIHWRISSIVS